jgi:hypothetical protein
MPDRIHVLLLLFCLVLFCTLCSKPLIKVDQPITYHTTHQEYETNMAYSASLSALGTAMDIQGALQTLLDETCYQRNTAYRHVVQLQEVVSTITNPYFKSLVDQLKQVPIIFIRQRSGTRVAFENLTDEASAYLEPIIHILYPVFPATSLEKGNSYKSTWEGMFEYEQQAYQISISIAHELREIYERGNSIFILFEDMLTATVFSEDKRIGAGTGTRKVRFNYSEGFIEENHVDFTITELALRSQVGFFGIHAGVTGSIRLDTIRVTP